MHTKTNVWRLLWGEVWFRIHDLELLDVFLTFDDQFDIILFLIWGYCNADFVLRYCLPCDRALRQLKWCNFERATNIYNLPFPQARLLVESSNKQVSWYFFFYKNHLADATHSSHWFDRSQVLMSLSRQKHNARLKHNAQNSVMLQTQFREEFTSLPVHHQKVTSCFF